MQENRYRTLLIFVAAIFFILIARLFYIQVIDDHYKAAADNNVLRHEVQYPPRGEIYDRNGVFLAMSIPSYDLMVVPRNMNPEGFDTARMAAITGVSVEYIARNIDKAKRFSRHRPSTVVKLISQESKLLFDEADFQGFFTVYRSLRSYPRKIAGNLLGYIGEVSPDIIERNPYYSAGDYIGYSGIESAYEDVLRGEKGTKINMVDVYGRVRESYQNGAYDLPFVAGTPITSCIDADLQQMGEELMQGKVGSIIAIEPSTGEILMMVSSPTYDPDELLGRDRGNNYSKMLQNPQRPLFNRAVMTSYPPGSTFKLVNGLIGLQEGVLTPSQLYPCHEGYTIGRGVGCHAHRSPLDLRSAVTMSCNAYFCYVFRDILDNPKYGGKARLGFPVWEEYVRSFGFGRKLGSDFSSELSGWVPTKESYDKQYRNSWNSLTVISLSIGQGELGCSPLQMANLAATVANRGYYYIPHVVKRIGSDSLESKYYEKNYTMVEERYFEPIVDGMYGAVHGEGGTAHMAYIPGQDVCGKTGTAQNSHGKNHSTFLCFAPKDNPKIAISVYVENGGWGGTVATPIASLLVEQYLTDTIMRPELYKTMANMKIYYPNYEK